MATLTVSEQTRPKVRPDRGIPMPAPSRGIGTEMVYPWDEMRVGDSFPLPPGKKSTTPPPRLTRAGWRFSSRNLGGVVRIWRIA